MKIAIDGNGYGDARVAFEGGNHRAATAYDDLTSRLRGLGAMAGSDSTSADFAAAYDDAATGAVGALGDLVASFATVGLLTSASLAAHRAAEEASIIAGAVVFEGSLPERGYVAVLPGTPPSCLGGDPPGLPHEVAWVLDQIEGFVWPGADTERLHRAAAAWRRTAAEVGVLTTYCDGARRGLAHETSPEIPLAVAATDDLRDAADEVASRMWELGGACDSYADQVEEHRQLVLDLVWAMLRDAVIVQGIGIVLGVVTAGITAAGAAAVNAARIAIEAPRILRIVTALRELVSAGARSVRITVAAVTRVRVRLRRFVEARVPRAGSMAGVSSSRMARLRVDIRDPRVFDPRDLQGMNPKSIGKLLDDWEVVPATRGEGWVYIDPVHRGRQVRVMEGYPGNRPDQMTHGSYAVVSQNNDKIKVALRGNPTL